MNAFCHLPKSYHLMTWLILTEYYVTDLFRVSWSRFVLLSFFMTPHRINNTSNTAGATVLIPLGSTVMGNEPDIVCSLHTDWQRLLWVATHLLTHAVNILYLYPNLGEYMQCEHMFLIHYQIKWKVIIFVMKLFIKITCKRK